MIDLRLTRDGDLDVSDLGDVALTNSVCQAVLIRLRWIYGEWRLGPEHGFPWFEEVFVKNPNLVKLRQLIRDEILEVDGVTGATVTDIQYNKARREATIYYEVAVGEVRYREEVTLYG